jgi:hypothetical protein
MKIALIVLAWAFFAQSINEPMVLPKVEHKTEKHEVTDETETRSCPVGYEGHFVDQRQGFDWQYWAFGNVFGGVSINGEPAFTVCFKKGFMDELRKNKDMVRMRPSPPRGV